MKLVDIHEIEGKTYFATLDNGEKCLVVKVSDIDELKEKTAYWKHIATDPIGKVFSCSLCGNITTTETFEEYPEVPFCSNCGSRMKGAVS